MFRLACFVVAAVVAILTCALCFLEVDRPVAQYISRYGNPEWALAAQMLAGLSACGLFVLAVSLVHRHLLSGEQKRSRDQLIVAFVSAVLAIVCVELLKFVFGRIGPDEYLTTGAYGFRYLSAQPGHSFPSEYGALAGLAAALLWTNTSIYRPTICLLALLLPASQLLMGTHFVSDIVAGLVIGALAFICVREVFSGSLPGPTNR